MKRECGAKTPRYTSPSKKMTVRGLRLSAAELIHDLPASEGKSDSAFRIGHTWRFHIEALDRWRFAAEAGRIGGSLCESRFGLAHTNARR
jgi:hypothetical protein